MQRFVIQFEIETYGSKNIRSIPITYINKETLVTDFYNALKSIHDQNQNYFSVAQDYLAKNLDPLNFPSPPPRDFAFVNQTFHYDDFLSGLPHDPFVDIKFLTVDEFFTE